MSKRRSDKSSKREAASHPADATIKLSEDDLRASAELDAAPPRRPGADQTTKFSAELTHDGPLFSSSVDIPAHLLTPVSTAEFKAAALRSPAAPPKRQEGQAFNDSPTREIDLSTLDPIAGGSGRRRVKGDIRTIKMPSIKQRPEPRFKVNWGEEDERMTLAMSDQTLRDEQWTMTQSYIDAQGFMVFEARPDSAGRVQLPTQLLRALAHAPRDTLIIKAKVGERP